MNQKKKYVSVDIRAESGRVMLGEVADSKLLLQEVRRFPNSPIKRGCWSDDEVNLLRTENPKGNARQLAVRLTRPLTAVRQKAYELGLKMKTYPSSWSEKEIEKLRKLIQDDLLISEIAKRLRRSNSAVSNKLLKLELKKRHRRYYHFCR